MWVQTNFLAFTVQNAIDPKDKITENLYHHVPTIRLIIITLGFSKATS
jgi:hypothetical protein